MHACVVALEVVDELFFHTHQRVFARHRHDANAIVKRRQIGLQRRRVSHFEMLRGAGVERWRRWRRRRRQRRANIDESTRPCNEHDNTQQATRTHNEHDSAADLCNAVQRQRHVAGESSQRRLILSADLSQSRLHSDNAEAKLVHSKTKTFLVLHTTHKQIQVHTTEQRRTFLNKREASIS